MSGVAVLGVVEYLRSRSFFKTHSEEIKSGLPILFFFLLVLITGSVAAVFFFLFFMGSFWQFALVAVAAIFAFLLMRIRKEQSFGALLVVQPEPAAGEHGAMPRRFTRVAILAVEAASAALMMVFMVPLAAGGFLLFRFIKIVLDMMGITTAILPYLFVLVVIFLGYYLFTRRRPPPS